MDLKIKDVSELLNVPESKIQRWLMEGKIPAYQLGHQYRFSRIEIEDWVMKSDLTKLDEDLEEIDEPKAPSGLQQFSLYRAINKGGVYVDVAGDTKEEIIRSTTQLLAKKFNWDADVLSELLIERERMMPTALSNGIGVPHTREFLLDTHFDVVTVVFPKNPIEYGSLDGKPVYALFFLFACEDKRHLHLLAKIAHLSSSPEDLAMLASKPSQQELLSYIRDWESKIAKKSI